MARCIFTLFFRAPRSQQLHSKPLLCGFRTASRLHVDSHSSSKRSGKWPESKVRNRHEKSEKGQHAQHARASGVWQFVRWLKPEQRRWISSIFPLRLVCPSRQLLPNGIHFQTEEDLQEPSDCESRCRDDVPCSKPDPPESPEISRDLQRLQTWTWPI
jgi:hypothetical protein